MSLLLLILQSLLVTTMIGELGYHFDSWQFWALLVANTILVVGYGLVEHFDGARRMMKTVMEVISEEQK